jgi:hypothetical protein
MPMASMPTSLMVSGIVRIVDAQRVSRWGGERVRLETSRSVGLAVCVSRIDSI